MIQRPVRRAYILMLIILSILAVIVGFKYILPLFLPFIFGYFLAWLAAPIVNFLQVRLRWPRTIASFLSVFAFLFVCVGGLYFLIRATIHQLQGFIQNLSLYEQMLLSQMDGICRACDRILGMESGKSYGIVVEKIGGISEYVQTDLMPHETSETIGAAKTIFQWVWNIILVFISALLFVKQFPEYKSQFQESCFYKEIHMVTGVLSDMGIAYLKAQFILMCITATICTIGIFLTKNPYAILLGIGIAIFDAFPVLGSAFILIPWAVILFLKKEIYHAGVILVTYIICQLIRQLLEPKLVGERIGIMPVYTLISMYIGLRIYGGFGFILGPISLVAMQAIVKAGIDYCSRIPRKQ